jgi:hypothetical protein
MEKLGIAMQKDAMNKKQKRILLAVIATILGMLLYPPFHLIANNGVVINMGYGWIFDPPKRGLITANVNVSVLLIQWVGILLVGGIAYLICKTSSEESLSSKVISLKHDSNNLLQVPEPENQSGTKTQIKKKPGPTGVGGWLLLLIVGMMILGPLLSAGHINAEIMMAEREYPGITSFEKWQTYKTITWLVFVAVATMSFYGGLGLAGGKDWSVVTRAKAILWVTGPGSSIVMGVLIPFTIFGEFNAMDNQFLGAFIGSVLAAAIWTIYLAKSKRVRNTYCSLEEIAST